MELSFQTRIQTEAMRIHRDPNPIFRRDVHLAEKLSGLIDGGLLNVGNDQSAIGVR